MKKYKKVTEFGRLSRNIEKIENRTQFDIVQRKIEEANRKNNINYSEYQALTHLLLEKAKLDKKNPKPKMANQQSAYNLAVGTLSELFKESPNMELLLKRCETISIMMGDKEVENWIKHELNGFDANIPLSKLKKEIPKYRNVGLLFENVFGKIILIPRESIYLQEYVVTKPIAEIVRLADSGFFITNGPIINEARKSGFSVVTAEVSSLYLKEILKQVRDRALDYINRIVREQSSNETFGSTQTPNGIMVIDTRTEDAHLLLYQLENKLRLFILRKIKENGGKIGESIMRDWQSSKKKEYRPPRQPLDCDLINYSSFDQLKKIIVQNENWSKIFKPYFGRPDGVISRINELDDIRDTIAHNRVLSAFDYNSFKTLYAQIIGCIEKKSDLRS